MSVCPYMCLSLLIMSEPIETWYEYHAIHLCNFLFPTINMVLMQAPETGLKLVLLNVGSSNLLW
jgi:hypothetical protein